MTAIIPGPAAPDPGAAPAGAGAGGATTPRSRRQGLVDWMRRSPRFLAHVVLIAAAFALWRGDRLDPQPPPRVERIQSQIASDSVGANDSCILIRDDDSLTRLAKRWPREEAIRHRSRWQGCPRLQMIEKAEETVALDPMHVALLAAVALLAVTTFPTKRRDVLLAGTALAVGGITASVAIAVLDGVANDWVLLGVLGAALALAVSTIRARSHWRLTASIAAGFALAYVAADALENVLLADLLEGGLPSPWLRWAASVKIGALFAASPAFLASLTMSFADSVVPPDSTDPVPTVPPWERAIAFVKRWLARASRGQSMVFVPERFVPVEPVPGRTVGLCASGGGIRSAAFNLGALQSLNARDELGRLRWLTCVSGGSYMAAAWVIARAKPDKGSAWERHSAEEDHLRRNASYLAPGVGGKLWAVTRFLFGLAINLGLVLLFLGALFMPYGWVVDRYQAPRPAEVAGEIELTHGGCIERPDGTFAVALAGAKVDVQHKARVELKRGVPPIRPAPTTTTVRARAGSTTTAPTTPGAAQAGADCAATMAALSVLATTTTTTAPRPVAGAPSPAPTVATTTTTALAAATNERRLAEGSKVALDLDRRSVPLAENQVQGCEDRATCERVAIVDIPSGSRLVSASEALLVLGDDVVSTRGQLTDDCGFSPCEEWRPPSYLPVTVAVVAFAAILGGIGVVLTRLKGEQANRAEAWTRRLVVFAFGFATLFDLVPRVITWGENQRRTLEEFLPPTVGVGSGVIVLALVSQAFSFAGGSKSEGTASAWVAKQAKSLWRRLQPLLLRAVVYVAGPIFLIGIALLFATDAARQELRPSQVILWLSIVGYLCVILAAGDLNEWSLHPFYRERLKVAFASDPKTLACSTDPLHELPGPPDAPELLVCAAANIADKRTTAPGRPVISWVFSKQGMGSRQLGEITVPARAADGTGGTLPSSMSHLDSAWVAVAVSGAAFSPAMGKMSRAERMLLALANLRLGQWCPNPRFVGRDIDRFGRNWVDWYETHHPRPWYLAKEALGLHSASDPWVYVTDGGHYENLGLVELVRRRCLEIYCFDAAGDSTDTFGTIADAMRIARAELGVEIEVDTEPMKADEDGVSRFASSAGVVRYPEADGHPEEVGWIVVAKLAVPADGPFDIRDLARTLPSFPNHPTADQLYTDQKFEAYRALGHVLGADAADLASAIRAGIAGPPAGVPADAVVEAAVAAALAAREPAEPA